MKNRAVVLLSGGLDSATTLAIAISEGYEVYAISFDYGQRHKIELEKATLLAKKYGVKHMVFPIPLNKIGGSALTDYSIDVPDNNEEKIGREVPITYVPARNTIFLSIAAAWSEVIGAEHIFIGTNVVDYSGYPDCRPEFIKKMEDAITYGTKYIDEDKRFTIHTPLSKMSKADIIKKGIELGVDYFLTNSCYNPTSDGKACGVCDACKLRLKGFKEAGFEDPVLYAKKEAL